MKKYTRKIRKLKIHRKNYKGGDPAVQKASDCFLQLKTLLEQKNLDPDNYSPCDIDLFYYHGEFIFNIAITDTLVFLNGWLKIKLDESFSTKITKFSDLLHDDITEQKISDSKFYSDFVAGVLNKDALKRWITFIAFCGDEKFRTDMDATFNGDFIKYLEDKNNFYATDIRDQKEERDTLKTDILFIKGKPSPVVLPGSPGKELGRTASTGRQIVLGECKIPSEEDLIEYVRKISGKSFLTENEKLGLKPILDGTYATSNKKKQKPAFLRALHKMKKTARKWLNTLSHRQPSRSKRLYKRKSRSL